MQKHLFSREGTNLLGRVQTRRCSRDVAAISYNKSSLNYASIFANSLGFILTPPGDGGGLRQGAGRGKGCTVPFPTGNTGGQRDNPPAAGEGFPASFKSQNPLGGEKTFKIESNHRPNTHSNR